MKKDTKIYDRNGFEVRLGDTLDDGSTLQTYWDELYICGERDMWKLEEFSLDAYNGGIKLVDFAKRFKKYTLVFYTYWGRVVREFDTLEELKDSFYNECIDTCRYTSGEYFLIDGVIYQGYSEEWKKLYTDKGEEVPYKH